MDITSINEEQMLEEKEQKLRRVAEASADGQRANSRGKLLGLLLKQACGAASPRGRGDNLATIDGVSVRLHTADGKSFSFNPKVEPPVLVFMSYDGKPTAEKPLVGTIYGLRLADCLAVGKTLKGNGTERISVSLASVKREPLGVAVFAAKWTEAESVQHRLELEDAVERFTGEELATMMSDRTRAKIRAFVLSGQEAPVPAPPAEALREAGQQPAADAGNGPSAAGADGQGA
jgi:hypothetical protein